MIYTYCRRCNRLTKLNCIDTEKKIQKICYNCRGQLEIIDEKIASVISLLNIKGYETLSWSSGNIEKYKSPYIVFNSNRKLSANIFNDLPEFWYVDLDADYDKLHLYTIIRYNKRVGTIEDFDFNHRELFLWVANLPFISDPLLSSEDAIIRAFIEYFLDEKYWNIYYSEKCSKYSSDKKILFKDNMFCNVYNLERNFKYKFQCSIDEYTKALTNIFGYNNRLLNLAIDTRNENPICTNNRLETYFPEFFNYITTLEESNIELFKKLENKNKSIADIEPEESKRNNTLHQHFLNQYQLYKCFKDKENNIC